MSPQIGSINWKRYGVIFACLVSAWQFGTYVYNGIENNKEATIKSAQESAVKKATRYADSVKTELRLQRLENVNSFGRWDSVFDDLHLLNKKNHIKDSY